VSLPARLALAVVSGLALATAFPALGWWPLAPVAVAGLSLATRGASARAGALLGLVFGLGFFVPHLKWTGVYVGPLPWLALAVVEALYLVPMAALLPLTWRLGRHRLGPNGLGGTALTVTAVGGLWVAQEAVRGRAPFGGFPWGRLAFSQSASPYAGLAALGGTPLISWAVAATGALLAVAAVAVAQRQVRPALAAATGAAGFAVLGLLVPLPTAGQPGPGGSSVQLAAVQGDVPEAGLEFNAERRAVLDNHARATLALAAQVRAGKVAQPQLVLWPENASDIDPLRNADAAEVIQAAVDTIGVPTLVGAVLDDGSDTLRNAGIVWSPDAAASPGAGPMYIKQHPVPFGEYIPYRSFFRHFSDKVDLVARDFVAGHSPGVLHVGPATVGDVICFEVAYDGLVRQTVRSGADLLVVQTNNATFGYTDESVQQLAMSRLRAIETGRAVVHVSTVGVSAIIEPDGSILRRSGHFTQDVLSARVPLRHTQTLAIRLGLIPELVLVLAGALALTLGGVAGRDLSGRAGRRERSKEAHELA
jgi:apolipoprotein N-acyltransferase